MGGWYVKAAMRPSLGEYTKNEKFPHLLDTANGIKSS
jgi:hypothetical protein